MGGELLIFPEWMLDPKRQKDVEIYLRELPVPPRRKKQALVAWCRAVGVAITKEKIESILKPWEKYAEPWKE